MPLYEYRCDKCGDVFEVMQKFSDEPLTTHEKCGGPVERLLSAPALQFKGSGWYITDYAKSGSSESTKSDGTKTDTSSSSNGKAAAEASSSKSDSSPAPAAPSSSGSDKK